MASLQAPAEWEEWSEWLAVALRHRLWGTIGLPIWSWMYVRRKDVAKLPPQYNWTFRTKLELAADLVRQAAETLGNTGKRLWPWPTGPTRCGPSCGP